MPYPSLYNVTYSYTGFQQAQGDNSFPGTQLDADLNGLEASIDGLAAFVERTLRSDGALNNGTVTYDSLSANLQTAGLAPAVAWTTLTTFSIGNNVVINNNLYRALLPHTSSVFATDLAAGKWLFVTALQVGAQGVQCQSALDWDPLSASKRDPFERRVRPVALAPSELAGVAETVRARVV